MSDETTLTWQNYLQMTPEAQEQILSGILDSLPHLTARQQAAQFENAPGEVILYFMQFICLEAQIKVYRDYLPVGCRDAAKPLLSREAQIRLKLRKRNQIFA